MNAETRLEQLEREVDRTRGEYQAAAGEERDQLWEVHRRALVNWNAGIAEANQRALRFPKAEGIA